MDNPKRLFGAGPACFIAGFIIIILFYFLGELMNIPKIDISNCLANIIFGVAIILTLVFVIWGFLSLPVSKRGKSLVTNYAFKYIRHPIYAGFLDFFIFGAGFYLKSYSVLIAGVLAIFICGKIVEMEESYMIRLFGKKYREYQKKTKKFIPFVY